jgi:hypothetical protein
VKPWSSMIFALRWAIARCSSGVGMCRKKLTSTGRLNEGRAGAVHHLITGLDGGAAGPHTVDAVPVDDDVSGYRR